MMYNYITKSFVDLLGKLHHISILLKAKKSQKVEKIDSLYIYITYISIYKHILHIFIAQKTASLPGSTNYLRNVDNRY